MARSKNYELMEIIKELNQQGFTDQEISRKLSVRGNMIQYYRRLVMNLPANWVKNDYQSEEDKLKGYIIRGIKCSAKRRGIEFDLHYSDLILPSHCPILGLPLSYKNFNGRSESNSPDFATVDRFDNTKGYIKGNVWIISRLANNMKNEATLDQIELFANTMIALLKNQRALGDITDSESLDL